MAKKQSPVKTYTTLTKIRHDGETYAKGDAIELTIDQAQPLLERAAIKPFLGAPTVGAPVGTSPTETGETE